LIEDELYACNETGVCQTGAFSTSEIDGFARVADARCSDGLCTPLAYGDDSFRSQVVAFDPDLGKEACLLPVPFPGYVSALDERDIVEHIFYLEGEPVNVCSRNFHHDSPATFQLTSWKRCVTKLAGITDAKKFAESAGGLLVECRHTPEAVRAISAIAEYRGFDMPVAAYNHNIDDYT